MPLKVEYKSKRNNTLEMKIRCHIADVTAYTDDVYNSHYRFNDELKQIKSGNAIRTEYSYKAILLADWQSYEVWHLDSTGGKKRLIAIVEKLS